jgi:hypothetical protein
MVRFAEGSTGSYPLAGLPETGAAFLSAMRRVGAHNRTARFGRAESTRAAINYEQ